MTIDTKEFRDLLYRFKHHPTSATDENDIIAHIDAQLAASRAAGWEDAVATVATQAAPTQAAPTDSPRASRTFAYVNELVREEMRATDAAPPVSEQDERALPPLPKAEYKLSPDSKPSLYNADQMRDYARAAIKGTPAAQGSEVQADPATWLDRDGRMIDALRDFIEGMSVSMDVSTGEHDAGHRYFGIINEVMDDDGDKNGVTLLVYDAQPNFAASPAPSAAPALAEDYIADRSYLNGLRAGWNLGVANDNARFDAEVEKRSAQLREARRELGAAPAQVAQGEPVAWIRFRSDGGYEGPIMNAAIEEVRKKSGAWTPLGILAAPVAPSQPQQAEAFTRAESGIIRFAADALEGLDYEDTAGDLRTIADKVDRAHQASAQSEGDSNG